MCPVFSTCTVFNQQHKFSPGRKQNEKMLKNINIIFIYIIDNSKHENYPIK